MHDWIVSQEDSGISIQQFLSRKLPALSQKKIKRHLDEGRCRLNQRVERFASTPVGRGDRIACDVQEETQPPVYLTPTAARLLYVDQVLAAYDKPPGTLSEDPALLKWIGGQIPRPKLLHRLDKGTSGILLFATEGAPATQMEKLFRERHVHKTYLALVDGVPTTLSGKVSMLMGKIAEFQGQALWGEVADGVWSETLWYLVRAGKETALIECRPTTGRTHQIRVHLASLGHPILGDAQYGRQIKSRRHVPRLMLHAAKVEFAHPVTGKQMAIEAPVPEDFLKECPGE